HTASPSHPYMDGLDEYKMVEKFYKSASIRINHNTKELASKLSVISLAVDSTGIEWICAFETGADPFTRLSRFMEAKEIKTNMDEVLTHMKLFLSKTENIYGIPVERNYLKDTLYVTTKITVPVYPSNATIYDLIKKIQVYAAKNGANQTGSPIFNVTEMDNNKLQLMAGIPVDKNFPESGGFSLKHMVRGSFMITEVVGGDDAIHKASKSLQQYFADYRKTSMAMNFTMLVTDRMYQADSSKWITKLYQPVY
ncbi:MAG: hypothetical protein ABIN25_03605, partial [Ginsengibacter sp.]